MSIVLGSLQQAGLTTAQIASATTTTPLVRQIVWNTQTNQYAIGDGVTTLNNLVFYGGSSGLTIGSTSITSGTNTRILYNNAGVVGEYLVTGTGTTAVLSTSPTFTTSIITPLITGVSGVTAFSNAATATGALITYNFATAAHTNQTLSTNIPNFKVTGSTKQWATGALATQYFNYFSANTVSFVGASTATDVFNMYIDDCVQGTNATLTNKYSLGLAGNLMISGNAIYLGKTTGNSTNHSFYGTALNTYVNAYTTSGTLNLTVNTNLRQYYNDYQAKYTGASFSGTLGADGVYMITPGAAINLTAGAEINMFQIPSFTWTWNTGALATQKFNVIKSPTIAFNGASTATNVYSLYVEAATAGTNATITNNYAAGFSGNVNIIGTPHVSGVAGVDGTFTTVDGKTVTVSKGLITAIV